MARPGHQMALRAQPSCLGSAGTWAGLGTRAPRAPAGNPAPGLPRLVRAGADQGVPISLLLREARSWTSTGNAGRGYTTDFLTEARWLRCDLMAGGAGWGHSGTAALGSGGHVQAMDPSTSYSREDRE